MFVGMVAEIEPKPAARFTEPMIVDEVAPVSRSAVILYVKFVLIPLE